MSLKMACLGWSLASKVPISWPGLQDVSGAYTARHMVGSVGG